MTDTSTLTNFAPLVLDLMVVFTALLVLATDILLPAGRKKGLGQLTAVASDVGNAMEDITQGNMDLSTRTVVALLCGPLVGIAVHLAALAIALGREEAALEHLRLGLEISPAPELAADRYAADPELQPLRALPGWAVIEAAGAGR